MTERISGGCRCGACRYSLTFAALPVTYACHCLNCQTMSGGACVVQAPVLEARLSIQGEQELWENTNREGQQTVQHFCAVCKTRLYSTNSARQGIALLRAGTLDESSLLAPAMHMWTIRKQPWITLPEGAEVFPENAPVERMRTVFASNFA